MSARLARLHNQELASEVSRHAAVAARHGSRAAVAELNGQARSAADWRYAADRAEDAFLAEVDEARRRLADPDPAVGVDLRRYLELYGAVDLVVVPADL